MMKIFFHGTGARRRQSIQKQGLLPKENSFIYASPNRLIAVVFAAARSGLEDDWGLLVEFQTDENYDVDPAFPMSVRLKQPVSPKDILSMEIVYPEDELKGYNFLHALVASIRLQKPVPFSIIRSKKQ